MRTNQSRYLNTCSVQRQVLPDGVTAHTSRKNAESPRQRVLAGIRTGALSDGVCCPRRTGRGAVVKVGGIGDIHGGRHFEFKTEARVRVWTMFVPPLALLRRRAPALISSRLLSSGAPSFPCVDAHAARESRLRASSPAPIQRSPGSGPEPAYARPNPTSYNVYHHPRPLTLTYSPAALPSFSIAYETWGTLSPTRDNVILLHTGLSASSHAASTAVNPSEGWWQKFIGPGKALDTNHFFIVCTNVLGGCYGSTGPSSTDSSTGRSYATTFPIISIFDMVRAQWCLIDHLKVDKLYASVGSSMGAMQSLAAAWLHPDRVGKVVSISGTARSTPSSVAMRYAQRSGSSPSSSLSSKPENPSSHG